MKVVKAIKIGVSTVVTLGLCAMVAAPMVSHAALPTSYKGHRVNAGNTYQSYTWTNGYMPGGDVTNTLESYIGGREYVQYKTKKGVNTCYSQEGGKWNAYHGIGLEYQISHEWKQN